MLLIRDVVEKNDQAADVGDVQIGWYPNSPFNLELARRYMFTASAEADKKPSIEILKLIRDTYLFPGENRLTVIATYGHGKTHLALALANFFGKPYDSPEVKGLLDSIRHTSEPAHQGFASFKADNPPFLVVRLQGNSSQSLHRLFLNAVAAALKEAEPYVGAVSLPFWFTEAAAFLETHRTDVASLLAAVRSHDGTVYELCREVSRHLNGVPADFGSDVSLDEVIHWLTMHYCGRDKPLRGLLVLFDEFGVFIEKYSEQRGSSNTGALQQLLDGIANARHAACFVAFSQNDPNDTAERSFARNGASGGQIGEQNLLKELTRLPHDKRFSLHSSLERVLDAYLKQVPEHLATITQAADEQFGDATDVTVQLLPTRYDYKQNWGTEEVHAVLTEGCFPLHPLTTGLLCTLQLQQGTVTRSVLGAVRMAMDAKRDQPALVEGRPNWIYPVALVDWFGDMISDERLWHQYDQTQRNVGGDATAVEADTLKAILLQVTANLVPPSHGPGGYARLVSTLSGHSEADCQSALKVLADRYLIDKDPVKELYRFPQGGEGEQARRLMKEVDRRADNFKLTATRLNDDWIKTERLKRPSADHLAAGNPTDYAAREWIWTRKTFTAEALRGFVARRAKMGQKGLELGERGGIVYLLAHNDEDATYFRDKAQQILDEAFPVASEMPVPIVVGIPAVPRPQMWRRIRKEYALSDMQADAREYGQAAVQKVRDTLKAEVDAELRSLREDAQWIVPSVFAAEVNRSAARNDAKIKLDCCYGLAYADMLPGFKKQYPTSNAQLRKAVSLLASSLALGQLEKDQLTIKNASAVAKDVFTSYLAATAQSSSWGVVDVSGAPQIPTKARIVKAWKHLEQCFAPEADAPTVQSALLPLLNPPFGYDANHVTLLFCAWVGYYTGRISFQEKGLTKRIGDYLAPLQQQKPEEFLNQLFSRGVTVRRMDEESENRRVRALIDATRTSILNPTDARNRVAEFTSFSQNPTMDKAIRDDAVAAIEKLNAAIGKSEEYANAVTTITRSLTTSTPLPEIIAHLHRIEDDKLPRPTLVRDPVALDVATLRDKVREHLKQLIEREVTRNSVLRNPDNYSEYKANLQRARTFAIEINEAPLQYEIDKSLATLEARKAELAAEQQDRSLINYLQTMHPASLPLAQLADLEKQLGQLKPRGERASELLEKRRTEVQKTIADEREFLARLPEALDGLLTQGQVSEQQRRLDKREFRFKGSDEEAEFCVLDTRLSRLEQVFRLLDKSPARTLNTPHEISEREDELRTAQAAYDDVLSGVQKQLFPRALEALSERRRAEADKAMLWIERYEAKPPRDVSVLDEPPPFLSQEGDKRLAELRVRLQDEIQKRVDRDETEAIVSRFQKLSPLKQMECLTLLQQQLFQQRVGQ